MVEAVIVAALVVGFVTAAGEAIVTCKGATAMGNSLWVMVLLAAKREMGHVLLVMVMMAVAMSSGLLELLFLGAGDAVIGPIVRAVNDEG